MKTVSSLLAGLFILLLAGGFILGGTNFTDILGPDQNTILIIDGKKVPFHQYAKFSRYFREEYKNQKNFDEDNFRQIAINRLIDLYLVRRLMQEWDYQASDEELRDFFLTNFRDKGKFDRERLLAFRKYFAFTDDDFRLLLEQMNFGEILNELSAVSQEDVRFQVMANQTKLQLKYLYIPNADLNKRLDKRIKLNEKEISEQISQEKKRLEQAKIKQDNDKGSKTNKRNKDKKSDKELRKMAMNRLKNKKRADLRQNLLKQLANAQKKGASLGALARLAGFPVLISNEFSPGERIFKKGDKKSLASGLHNSTYFAQKILSIKNNQVLGPISSSYGDYYVSILGKKIPNPKSDQEKISEKMVSKERILEYQLRNIFTQDIYLSFRNQLKIERYDSRFFKK